ncbi:hypothetical protein [Nitrosovibrio tenuis]|uniref:hypothetical protein n=1 Tax=Nitrosovibrio tenuis TaxID=1233 RepID=UPI00115FC13C|nr:hypothetical protein [Nitrosovibrio tenuis]
MKIRRLFLPFFTVLLLGLTPGDPACAFDGHDGDFDSWDDDGHDEGDDAGTDGGDDSGAGHQGAEGQGHHERDGPHYAHAWPGWGPGWGFAPAFGGFGVGLDGFGGPGFGAFGYSSPYYPSAFYDYRPIYYAPIIVPPAPPPVYIQKQNTPHSGTGAQPGYWHYCREPEGYYPQVQECPDGWEQVSPQPQNADPK